MAECDKRKNDVSESKMRMTRDLKFRVHLKDNLMI